jgi:hypothetical protein
MIKNVCGFTIDFSKIEMVGPLKGDPKWESYTVYFNSGKTIKFYEERQHACGSLLPHLKRENFIAMWQNQEKYPDSSDRMRFCLPENPDYDKGL